MSLTRFLRGRRPQKNPPGDPPRRPLLPISSLPTALRVEDAVEAGCAADIAYIEERLRRGSRVLVECDKDLALYLFLAVRNRLRRDRANAPNLVIIDGRPDPNAEGPPVTGMARMLQQLTEAIRGGVERTIIVFLHLDVLTTTHTGLTSEAREAIPLLYENPEVGMLGFRDPSFEIPKVISDVFDARREITGILREALPRLITQREARALDADGFDNYGLYKYVSGLNPVRCRQLFVRFNDRREATPGRPAAQEVYAEIRRQTTAEDFELPNVDLDRDIGGYEEVKAKLHEDLLDLVLRRETLRSDADIQALEKLLPRGIIFYGPPGTGKTYFAKAIATAINASVIIVAGPELKSKWVGQSEENLRRIFRRARQSAPCVVVFDEIDAFAQARGAHENDSGVGHSMVNQLLTEMDGFRSNEMIFVVGTTNLLESVDGALLRPGRFEFLIEIPAPGPEDRAAIIRIYNEKLALGLSEALVAHLVRRTEGLADHEHRVPFSGDHLYAVCRALKRQALRTGRTGFTADDIDKALQRKSHHEVVLTPAEERVIAIHESGHALVSLLLPQHTPPRRVTIAQDVPGALGYVEHGGHSGYGMSQPQLQAEICICLGGQAAERLLVGEATTGAAADLQRANELARAMVEQYGMSRELGPRVVLEDEQGRRGSWRRVGEARQARADAEIDRILQEEAARAEALLRDHQPLLDATVAALLEKKTLLTADLQALAAAHPAAGASEATAPEAKPRRRTPRSPS